MTNRPFRITLCLLLLLAAAAVTAHATTCTVTRAEVQAALDSGASTDDVQALYGGCTAADESGTSASSLTTATAAAAGGLVTAPAKETITNTGSTYWEAIQSCGYHPQREELDCSVEIRQRFGYGGQICAAPGSHELVLFCADFNDGLGLVPVNTNGFHLHDERFGVNPNWYFGAVVQSNARLLAVLNDGRTLKGRAILSWQLPPTGCNYIPIWGNQADFRFRLDP